MKNFADLPAEIRRRVDAGERVILILLDAFGLEFLERHRDHPLIERLDVTPLTSQFPSTTTAHVSSLHFGMPVHEHGARRSSASGGWARACVRSGRRSRRREAPIATRFCTGI